MYSANQGVIFWNGLTPLTKSEMIVLLTNVVTRKERNSGLLRHLLRTLERTHSCEYIRGIEIKNVGISRLALFFEKTSRDRYRTYCPDSCAEFVLARANKYFIPRSPSRKRMQRTVLPLPKPPVPLKRLRGQYSHTEITWGQALSIFAYALSFGKRVHDVKQHLRGIMHGKNHAYRIRLQGITMEIELHGGVQLPDDHTQVGIYCEKDNQHRVYRRLRKRLRDTFHLSDKVKRKRAKEIKNMRMWRKQQRILFAVTTA